ncbi:SDR family NAD(P)-dependent oxidoreductase [Pseudonocardia endophytica]|uniref:SDR family NAD(P)-dependent oxidoreductase n=1 Tax=Pseudonocardia endophytica TaxID=401976 RepID=UPI0024370661|nr:SDR family oxidoreductase [Pseudonocardia endophytica]
MTRRGRPGRRHDRRRSNESAAVRLGRRRRRRAGHRARRRGAGRLAGRGDDCARPPRRGSRGRRGVPGSPLPAGRRPRPGRAGEGLRRRRRGGAGDGRVRASGHHAATPLLEVTAEQAQRCLLVNIMGSINTIQAAAPYLAPGASIVLCSSVAAYTGGGYVGGPVYGASKAGVIGLTKGAARELAPRKIRVNCIAPGCTATSMIGDDPEVIATLAGRALAGRLAEPDEIARAALYLWSSASSYMTGAVLDVNGGIRL